MLRVVHLSTTDVSGGAALAAHRLHQALPDHAVHSTMFVASKRGEDAGVVEFQPAFGGPRALNQFLFRGARHVQRQFLRFPKGTFMTHDWAFLGGLVERQLPESEIVHLHWAADLLDFRVLARLATRVPVIWTFHDMNAFTGGCHYTRGCDRFAGECGACPLLDSSDPGDVTYRVLRRKVAALRAVPESRLTIASPSRWMAAEARRSTVFGRFPIEVIPNGVDVQTFRPLERSELRRQLGFSPADRVILFVAEKLGDPRKGRAELEQAIAQIAHLPNLKVLTLGNGVGENMQGPMYRHLGSLHDAVKICEAYNAADVFVIPTLQDNFPNTVLEAMASGTPVVGFATGGVVDAVLDGVCGLLAPTGDVAGFAANITRALLDDALRIAMSDAARIRAVECYSLERQAAACASLYRRMLGCDSPQPESEPAALAGAARDQSLSA
jgi:glycosyltransferase involved in cell wall biosynthesis